MLNHHCPNHYRQQYRELQQALERLRLVILPAEGDQGSSEGDQENGVNEAESTVPKSAVKVSVGSLVEGVAEITQQFQQRILGLNLAEMDEAIALRIQSIQTEIGKQLRLLAMDTMFLKTARQPETDQQRRRQMGDRVDLLLRYCEAVLAADFTTDSDTESEEQSREAD